MKLAPFHLLAVALIFNCASSKREFFKTGNQDAAIQNAILDFSNNTSLHRRDSVFSVNYVDTLYRMVLNKSNGNYIWVNGQVYLQLVAVGIRSNSNHFPLTASTTIGSRGKLPSRFLEKDGRLFFWWDNEYPLTEEALAAYKRYGLLFDNRGGVTTMPDFVNDDEKKGAHYYFCRGDLTKYKRVVTNKGIGYYDPPHVRCE